MGQGEPVVRLAFPKSLCAMYGCRACQPTTKFVCKCMICIQMSPGSSPTMVFPRLMCKQNWIESQILTKTSRPLLLHWPTECMQVGSVSPWVICIRCFPCRNSIWGHFNNLIHLRFSNRLLNHFKLSKPPSLQWDIQNHGNAISERNKLLSDPPPYPQRASVQLQIHWTALHYLLLMGNCP